MNFCLFKYEFVDHQLRLSRALIVGQNTTKLAKFTDFFPLAWHSLQTDGKNSQAAIDIDFQMQKVFPILNFER
ncbi:hypothetical protein [Nitrosomonas sp. Nm33]|uniref:hypothetical protein n=1 Tax=Nitrosomonas sp. Nm33 TaxID=133724 RepID=UPI00089D4416|nr:hypothetical protein [Nitrosomonas sp. Nm33]SDZ06244.1 hypothetical protein SAMN05421755_10975 [Nitrosomonas sp. Nm33]